MKCRKCGKSIIESRQPYRHIGKFYYAFKKGYIYKAYEHIDCNAPLLPKSKSFKDLCQRLNLKMEKRIRKTNKGGERGC